MTTRWRGSLAPAVTLLALCGVWLTHVLEYLRTVPQAHVGTVAAGSAHAYMVPLGGLLAIAAGLAGGAIWRAWARTGARVDGARAALLSALRGHAQRDRPPRRAPLRPPSLSGGVVALWLPLAALQVLLYIVQETVEAAVAGQSSPGLGAVTGRHWAAPLLHLGVALVLAAVVSLVARLLGARHALAAACERLLDVLAHVKIRPRSQPAVCAVWRPTPLELGGWAVWGRPPPATAPA